MRTLQHQHQQHRPGPPDTNTWYPPQRLAVYNRKAAALENSPDWSQKQHDQNFQLITTLVAQMAALQLVQSV